MADRCFHFLALSLSGSHSLIELPKTFILQHANVNCCHNPLQRSHIDSSPEEPEELPTNSLMTSLMESLSSSGSSSLRSTSVSSVMTVSSLPGSTTVLLWTCFLSINLDKQRSHTHTHWSPKLFENHFHQMDSKIFPQNPFNVSHCLYKFYFYKFANILVTKLATEIWIPLSIVEVQPSDK